MHADLPRLNSVRVGGRRASSVHGHVVLIDRSPSATLIASLRAANFDLSCIASDQPLAELAAHRPADAVIIAGDHPARERLVHTLEQGRTDAPLVWLERDPATPLVMDVIHDPPRPDELRVLAWITTAERAHRREL